MSSSLSIDEAFGANCTLGSDNGVTYYVSWDATYLYLGWKGGNFVYSSDTYFVGIDTDPDASTGNTEPVYGATFSSSNTRKLDYYLFYENTSVIGGSPTSEGNAFELWQNSSGNWSFVSRTGGDDGSSSQVNFVLGGDVRLRIAWSSINFTPSSSTKLGVILWTSNYNTTSLWSSFPSTNPTGGTPQQMVDYIVFNSTGSDVNTNEAGDSTPLPVELTSFNGKVVNSKINLNWNTATEVNNYGFEVERAKAVSGNQSVQFAKVGFVEGNGNSNSPKSYSFTDINVTSGKYVYRLKQIDTDGQFEYSQEIEVSVDNLINGYVLEQNYPNPFNPATSIKFGFQTDTRAEVKVYNVIGAEVATLFNGMADAGRIYEVTFDAGGLASGTYFYKLVTTGKTDVRKMILMK